MEFVKAYMFTFKLIFFPLWKSMRKNFWRVT